MAAGLRACRRVNDLSLAVRFLEHIKIKCGSEKTRKLVYPYIIQEVFLIFILQTFYLKNISFFPLVTYSGIRKFSEINELYKFW